MSVLPWAPYVVTLVGSLIGRSTAMGLLATDIDLSIALLSALVAVLTAVSGANELVAVLVLAIARQVSCPLPLSMYVLAAFGLNSSYWYMGVGPSVDRGAAMLLRPDPCGQIVNDRALMPLQATWQASALLIPIGVLPLLACLTASPSCPVVGLGLAMAIVNLFLVKSRSALLDRVHPLATPTAVPVMALSIVVVGIAIGMPMAVSRLVVRPLMPMVLVS